VDSRRLKKVSTLLQETLSGILAKEGALIYGTKCLVTITNVVVTPDLSVARFYFSIFNAESNEEVLVALHKNMSKLRGLIGNVTRHQLRKIPNLEFYLDDTLEYVDKMDKLFKQIEEEKAAIEKSKKKED
jgi:ribosome-binding factor A